MDEKQIADRLNNIIDAKVNKAFESLNLQIAAQKEMIANLSDTIEVVKEFGIDSSSTLAEYKSNDSVIEIKLLESQKAYTDLLDDKFDALNEFNKEDINSLSTELKKSIADDSEKLSLTLSNAQGQELLRLNDHVNRKLSALKGDKGDAGEKGDKGDSGFLSRVSKWENGSITKQTEAVIHNNALWTCAIEQSAKEPSVCDDWTLIVDGISEVKMDDNNIQIKYASGKTQDIGRVGFVHKGQYDSKKEYMKGDIVTVNKTAFVSMEDDNKNNPPSNNWRLLSGKGDKGAKGDRGGNIEVKELTTLIMDVIEGMK